MASSVIFEERVEIPLTLQSLADFRVWSHSEQFPERGRIDYIAGRIEVDMSPEDLFCHGTLKTEVVAILHRRVKQQDLGHLFTDSTRVCCPQAELSAEPDIVFLSHETLDAQRVLLVPAASQKPGRYIELEGPPDVVVEIVSDSSVGKDTRRLPAAYFAAGVKEFWLADARNDPVVFRIHGLGDAGYQAAEPDADGFQPSAVFGCSFRLDSRRTPQGYWAFDLREKD